MGVAAGKEWIGGLAEEGRLRRCPESGGEERERERASRRSRRSGALRWTSWGNRGWLGDWVGVVGGVERPEAVEGKTKEKQ